MYSDPTHLYLLDQTDYNQYAISREEVAEELPYITESLQGMLALLYNGECVGVQLPAAVELTITQCDPPIRGGRPRRGPSRRPWKPGLVVQVPEYLKQGERIKVDTRSGVLSRA